MIEGWGYKQVDQVLRCHVASSALAVRATTQSSNTAVKCPDPGFQSNQTVDDSLAIRIMEVASQPLRGEAALLDKVVYKPTDGTYNRISEPVGKHRVGERGLELTWRANPIRIPQTHLVTPHVQKSLNNICNHGRTRWPVIWTFDNHADISADFYALSQRLLNYGAESRERLGDGTIDIAL